MERRSHLTKPQLLKGQCKDSLGSTCTPKLRNSRLCPAPNSTVILVPCSVKLQANYKISNCGKTTLHGTLNVSVHLEKHCQPLF